MKGQWGIIVGLVVALIISIFAVINVEAVRVNYLFGEAYWPLVLIILGSVLMGAVIVGALGMVKIYRLQAEIKRLKQQKLASESEETKKSDSQIKREFESIEDK
ncbi:LapA family protein [Alkalihalobacillus sp. 1P02AB]|uniref:LapA family protein n=1 Tax=Alkalihalobacillus sp. 1P02AB TaxID=3132260 RepID=UPI0039A45315